MGLYIDKLSYNRFCITSDNLTLFIPGSCGLHIPLWKPLLKLWSPRKCEPLASAFEVFGMNITRIKGYVTRFEQEVIFSNTIETFGMNIYRTKGVVNKTGCKQRNQVIHWTNHTVNAVLRSMAKDILQRGRSKLVEATPTHHTCVHCFSKIKPSKIM